MTVGGDIVESRMKKTATAKAWELLGVKREVVSGQPRITPQLGQIATYVRKATSQPGKIPNFPTNPYYFLSCSDDPDSRRVLEVYYSLPQSYRKLLPIEAYCVAAGVPTLRLLEIITGACVRLGMQASTLVAAITHPTVVEKTVQMALTDEGSKDREMLHKHAGFLPTPRGPSVKVSVNQQTAVSASATASEAPKPEDTIKRLVDRFNDARTLPVSQPAQLPEKTLDAFPVMPHEDLVPVDVEEDED